jgi:hypothetical protein
MILTLFQNEKIQRRESELMISFLHWFYRQDHKNDFLYYNYISLLSWISAPQCIPLPCDVVQLPPIGLHCFGVDTDARRICASRSSVPHRMSV